MITLIYTDASYDKRHHEAGLGVVIYRHSHSAPTQTSYYQQCVKSSDSNLAELQAVLFALSKIDDADDHIIIMTDNKNVKRTIKRPNREEYTGERAELGKRIRKILDSSPARTYKIYHVKGHSMSTDQHSKNQKLCDKMANAVRKAKRK